MVLDLPVNLPVGVFTLMVQESGLLPSMGSGDCFDNAIIEAFWARMQTEPFDL